MPDMFGNYDNYPNRGNEPSTKGKMMSDSERRMKIVNETIHCTSDLKKVPEHACYMALERKSYSYDTGYGDNGRPDYSTAYTVEVTAFLSTEALEEWVLTATKGSRDFKIIRMSPVQTEVKAVFSIKE